MQITKVFFFLAAGERARGAEHAERERPRHTFTRRKAF